jgi:plasmid maintenance system antidote protein VapI
MTIKLLGESGIISDGQASRVKLRLRDIIRESHLRQTEIANRIGISARAWSRICNRGHAISHWMENRLMWQELASVLGV